MKQIWCLTSIWCLANNLLYPSEIMTYIYMVWFTRLNNISWHKTKGWIIKKNWCFRIVVLEKTWESPGQQGDQTNHSSRKSTMNIHWKDWFWSWSSNTLAIWCEELTHWKRPWCWERSKAKEEGDNRGWDGYIASLTQWAWIQANTRRYWRIGEPDMLQSMGQQRVRHNLGTRQQQSQEEWDYLQCSSRKVALITW